MSPPEKRYRSSALSSSELILAGGTVTLDMNEILINKNESSASSAWYNGYPKFVQCNMQCAPFETSLSVLQKILVPVREAARTDLSVIIQCYPFISSSSILVHYHFALPLGSLAASRRVCTKS